MTIHAHAISEVTFSVFDFSNYRQFLSQYIKAQQLKDSKFSWSYFVKKAGISINSRGHLKLVIEGKKNLGQSTIIGLINACKLQGEEAHYFENLVYYNQSKNSDELHYYFSKLQSISKKDKKYSEPKAVTEYQLFSSWIVHVIYEMFLLKNFKADPRWIAQKIVFPTTVEEINSALEIIKNLGLIQYEGKEIKRSSSSLFVPEGHYIQQNYLFKKLHMSFLKLTEKALQSLPIDDCSAFDFVLPIKAARFEEFRNEIKELNLYLMDKYAETEDDHFDLVVKFGTQLYKLTK
jgi:uncharacterized protein (TIGR02147 family)